MCIRIGTQRPLGKKTDIKPPVQHGPDRQARIPPHGQVIFYVREFQKIEGESSISRRRWQVEFDPSFHLPTLAALRTFGRGTLLTKKKPASTHAHPGLPLLLERRSWRNNVNMQKTTKPWKKNTREERKHVTDAYMIWHVTFYWRLLSFASSKTSQQTANTLILWELCNPRKVPVSAWLGFEPIKFYCLSTSHALKGVRWHKNRFIFDLPNSWLSISTWSLGWLVGWSVGRLVGIGIGGVIMCYILYRMYSLFSPKFPCRSWTNESTVQKSPTELRVTREKVPD